MQLPSLGARSTKTLGGPGVRVGVLVAGTAVLVGVSDGVAVGVFVGVSDGVAVFVGVAVGVELGTCVLVGTAVLVLVGTGVGVYGMQIPFWQVPFRHSASVQHAPKGRHIGAPGPNEQQCSESAQQAFPHTWAAGQQYCPLSIQTPEQQPSTVQTGSPGSQQDSSGVHVPKQHAPSQQTDCPETQHAAPHMSLPSGQQQSVPHGIWLPGQVGGRGVGVGRRRAPNTQKPLDCPAPADTAGQPFRKRIELSAVHEPSLGTKANSKF